MPALRSCIAAIGSLALLGTGCLSNTHVIPRSELEKLAQTDPHQRGKRVRVVQNLTGADDPPRVAPVAADTQVSVDIGVGWTIEGPVNVHAGGGSSIARRTPPPPTPGPGSRHTPSSGAGAPGAPRPHGSTPGHTSHAPRPSSSGSSGGSSPKLPSSGGSSGSSSSGGSSDGNAAAAAVIAAAVVIAAAGAVVILAVTEGKRYDGWVELHPMHPVHLYSWDGRYMNMPLAHVTPEIAAWTRKAVVRDVDGPWRAVERAPLNRRGWTYTMLIGSAEVPAENNEKARGAISHLQIGRYLSSSVGLLGDLSLGWTRNSFGDYMTDSRFGLELQLMPLSAGKFHGGAFGQIGSAVRWDDRPEGADKSDSFYGAGAMMQIELSTRLALTARAGITWVFDTRSSDFTAGLSVY